MSEAIIFSLKEEVKRLKNTVKDALKFKAWAFDQLAKAGIAFVSEDFDSTEYSFDPNSCVCGFCGAIYPRKEQSCELQHCRDCNHQMQKNRWNLPPLKDR